MSKQNIILIGLRGSGKTRVGKILAKKLGWNFVELDELVVKKAGLSIPEIVKKHGWRYFRYLETKVLKEISGLKKSVISTGGGVVTRQKNIKILKEIGIVFWPKVSPETAAKRIVKDKSKIRPPLTKQKSLLAEMKEILKKRGKLYQKTANHIIDTENSSLQKVAREILQKL